MATPALCTVDDVRLFLQKSATDNAQDDIIEWLILSASRLILRECGRELIATPTAESRYFPYDGSGLLDIAPYDLRTVNFIKVDGVTLLSTEYRQRPRPSREGVITYFKIDRPFAYHVGFAHESEVEINGLWGWPAVPEEAKLACVVTVAVWLRRNVQTFTSALNLTEDRVERPSVLPDMVYGIISPLRRPVLA